jgi:hypothetical protein
MNEPELPPLPEPDFGQLPNTQMAEIFAQWERNDSGYMRLLRRVEVAVLENVRQLLADNEARIRADELVQWQPIKTAPKDGTPVLGWNAEYGARETRSITFTPGSPGFAQGRTDRWWQWGEPIHNWASSWNPTHWMPLPNAPEAIQELKELT